MISSKPNSQHLTHLIAVKQVLRVVQIKCHLGMGEGGDFSLQYNIQHIYIMMMIIYDGRVKKVDT